MDHPHEQTEEKFEEDGCNPANQNDFVDDTPQQFDFTDGCPKAGEEGYDTCPNLPGVDPIHNYMGYASDDCVTEFTPGQWRRMYIIWSLFRQQDESCGTGNTHFELEFEVTDPDIDELVIEWQLEASDGSLLISNILKKYDSDVYEFGDSRVLSTDICIQSSKQYVLTLFRNVEGANLSEEGIYRVRLDNGLAKEGTQFGADERFVFFANGSGSPPTVPTPSPVSPTTPPTGGFCFSGDTVVAVKDKGLTPMVDLMVGDHILASDGQYALVYAFGHRDPTISATFLQFMPSMLELSEDHMLFIQGRGFIPASMVKVGDRFDVNAGAVEAIHLVVRQGVYAPFTTSGTLLANGVLSSSYVAFQGSDKLMLGSYELPISFQWLAHSFLAPFRIWRVSFGGINNISQNDLSMFLKPCHQLFTLLLKHETLAMGVLLGPFTLLCLLFYTVEAFGGTLPITLVFTAAVIICRTKASKKTIV